MKNDVESTTLEAIEEFHKRFYPEARVQLLGTGPDGRIAILFTGNMCLTCGMSDYFVDFLEILKSRLSTEYCIEDFKELDDEGTAWIVIYTPARLAGEVKMLQKNYYLRSKSQEQDKNYTLRKLSARMVLQRFPMLKVSATRGRLRSRSYFVTIVVGYRLMLLRSA
ncbi:MAG: hypothetical protein QXH55_01995 [Candidatus Korarchaeota archaeon]|nr:hypothetical protein [Thermoproteota archaeon]MCR8462899.1 hypothetical protein [Thermoproteota archaeon]MCR8470371.1 hypothetical protein [Thermoproteota archaeon]MCR8472036.1 hypothetical protein [Thermoproteota archaeon]MCR8488285.1 hypothetical protein [Thermoproteota archaeon]